MEALGADWSRVKRVADRKGHDGRYSLSDVKLRCLGYAPRVAIQDGLAETIRWYVDNRAWCEPLIKRAEDRDSA